jgi:GNAT superfamily N-acetyltransferase
VARLRKPARPHAPPPAVDLALLQRRPAQPADLADLLALVEKTLRKYVEQSLGPWDPLGAERSIAASLDQCDWQILSLDGARLGAIAVVRDEREMRLAELFLEPAFHGRGWGTALVQEVIAEASQRGLPLRLRVLRSNPARRLYARLGFEVEQSSPERLWMVVQPRGRPPF